MRETFHVLLPPGAEKQKGDEYWHPSRRKWLPYDPIWPPITEPAIVRRLVHLESFEDFWMRESMGKADHFWNIAKHIALSAFRQARRFSLP